MNEVVLLRMACTGLVVVGVSWAVGALGPLLGGALAGLPMVIGPAFFFLVRSAEPPFVAQMATYTLMALSASQCFVFTYMAAARRCGPALSLLCALLVWLVAGYVCRVLPASVGLGLLLFAALTAVAVHHSRAWVALHGKPTPPVHWFNLLLRGVLAGALVAVITAASGWLGPASAGVLLAFPIGYTVIATTIHSKMGAASVVATLHAALLGGCSLVAFASAMALLVTRMPPALALVAALLASVLTTLALVLRARARR